MLILKLTLVPLALLLFGVIERRHGPRVAGWLAGFPMVAGPVLVLLALDRGAAFASAAGLGAYFGLLPWLAFTGCYAWCSDFCRWPPAFALSLAAWALTAIVCVQFEDVRGLEVLPFLILLAALFLYPRGEASDQEREHVWWGLPARMLAGAALTLLIMQFAGAFGTRWSGIFTTFPVMGSIVAVSSHIEHGRHAVREAVAGMTTGLASVAVFCFAAWLLLARTGLWPAFALALMASCATHALTWLMFKKR
ncbi:MAG: hypothetical protein JO256_01015 [Alphaproteobacteria bacterium]|nr:hypothetical protein [Alphaproteobacteria bacterium]